MIRNFRHNYFQLFFILAAISYWGLAIAGAFRSYSPIPYWDMWTGYLEFYIKAGANNAGAWWEAHNEHRILLSRLFFWVDLAWFNGSIWFLILVNYLLVALSCFVFVIAIKETIPKYYLTVGLFITAWLSSWCQYENLTWGFQSQFILAQFLPLIAFLCLHRSLVKSSNSHGYFIGACFFGIISLGSMANGVIALPLMTLYMVITRSSWKRTLALASFSVVGLFTYFYEFSSPAGHGSFSSTLRENPFGLVLYVLTYVGGPFHYIVGGPPWGVTVAQIAGTILIFLSTFASWKVLRSSKKSSIELALLFFILYIGGTAVGTAGGRLVFGVEQALSSRYMTPSLMAWAAIFVVIGRYLSVFFEKFKWLLWMPMLLLTLAMLPTQLKALDEDSQSLFERKIAGLAVAMGVNDRPQISRVFPDAGTAISIGRAASERGLSFFSSIEFRNLAAAIGKPLQGFSAALNQCQGYIDHVNPVVGDKNYLRISGWMFNEAQKSPTNTVLVINQQGFVVGFGMFGNPRPDVAKAVNLKAGNAGFKGYVLKGAQGSPVTVFDPANDCGFSFMLPLSLFTLSAGSDAEAITVDMNQVLSGSGWIGTDHSNSKIKGANVMGSFIHSDADRGRVSLRIKSGDRMLYKSGPTSGKQYLDFHFLNESVVLPVAEDWVVLDFSSNLLPQDFVVTFRDDGEAWGEWSAIALLNRPIN